MSRRVDYTIEDKSTTRGIKTNLLTADLELVLRVSCTHDSTWPDLTRLTHSSRLQGLICLGQGCKLQSGGHIITINLLIQLYYKWSDTFSMRHHFKIQGKLNQKKLPVVQVMCKMLLIQMTLCVSYSSFFMVNFYLENNGMLLLMIDILFWHYRF